MPLGVSLQRQREVQALLQRCQRGAPGWGGGLFCRWARAGGQRLVLVLVLAGVAHQGLPLLVIVVLALLARARGR